MEVLFCQEEVTMRCGIALERQMLMKLPAAQTALLRAAFPGIRRHHIYVTLNLDN